MKLSQEVTKAGQWLPWPTLLPGKGSLIQLGKCQTIYLIHLAGLLVTLWSHGIMSSPDGFPTMRDYQDTSVAFPFLQWRRTPYDPGRGNLVFQAWSIQTPWCRLSRPPGIPGCPKVPLVCLDHLVEAA